MLEIVGRDAGACGLAMATVVLRRTMLRTVRLWGNRSCYSCRQVA